jgi:hypothetical protein
MSSGALIALTEVTTAAPPSHVKTVDYAQHPEVIDSGENRPQERAARDYSASERISAMMALQLDADEKGT